MFAILPRLRAAPLPRLARLAAAAAATVVLAACEPGAFGTAASGPGIGPSIDPAQPVTVALLVPTGSGDSDLEWLGRSLANAGRMAAADAEGARIDLRVYPTGADSASAAASASQAIGAGAKIIVGPLHADAANAAGAVARGAGINVLSFSNNTQIAGGNVYTLGTSFGNVADRLVGYGLGQGKRRFLVVAEDDVAGQLGANAIQGAIARNGAVFIGRVNHEISTSGIDAAIPAVAAAAQANQIDAVFMTANQPAVLPYLSNGLRTAGVTPGTQLMGLTRFDEPAIRLTIPGLDSAWFALPDVALHQQFEARYQAAHGERPHALAGLAYDGVSAIAALVRAGRSDALTTGALTRKAGFAGVNGVFRLDRDGTTTRGLAVATVRNQQVVILDPAPRSFGGFGF